MIPPKKTEYKLPRPPGWAHWLISRLSLYEGQHSIIGDFEESFRQIISRKNIYAARLWYSVQAISSIFSYFRLVLAAGTDLLINYIKVSIRSLRRYKLYTAINISGLTIGLTAVFLIVLYVSHELSFDRQFENAQHIQRIVSEDYVGTPYILGEMLKDRIPGIEEIVRLKHLTADGPIMLAARGRMFMEKALYMADASIFKVFSLKFLYGNPETALIDPNSVVLTESAARRYFGQEDPLGEIILHNDDLSLQVTAVVADLPSTTHFHFNAVIHPAHAARFSWGVDDRTSWTSFNYITYLLLHSEASPDEILENASELVNSHREKPRVLYMQSMLDIHLHSHLRGELEENGDMSYLNIYMAVGIIILLLACINFMNLGSAHSFNRSGEVGIRKVLGAQRMQIVNQFIGEDILIALLSAVLAVIFAQLTLPFFRQLSGRGLSWGSVPWAVLVPVLFIIVILTGIAAGCYPAFYASSFHPVHTLKGALKVRSHRFPLQNLLVGLQFVVSILFMGCTMCIFSQIHYLKTRELGIDQSRIITVRLPDAALGESEAIKTELLTHSAIIKATASTFFPSGTPSRHASKWEGKADTEDIYFSKINVDEDFISTFGIELVAGEEFQAKHRPGSTYIVNQVAAKLIGGQVVGKTINIASGAARPGKIVGVVRDFNFRSLHHAVEPMVLFLDKIRMLEFRGDKYNHTPFRYISVKVDGNDLRRGIKHVSDVCRNFIPYDPDCWFFFDEAFGRIYRLEQKTAGVMVALSLIAVALASMGLLGLSVHAVERRRKEIGIRRVLGASVSSVLFLFFRDFLYIHSAAMLVAFPLLYWAMNRWLANFAYQIPIGLWVFVVTATLTAALFFTTGSFSIINAATAQPVKSLRYE